MAPTVSLWPNNFNALFAGKRRVEPLLAKQNHAKSFAHVALWCPDQSHFWSFQLTLHFAYTTIRTSVYKRACVIFALNFGGTAMTSELDEKVKASLVNGKLPCATAFKIAKQLGVSPKEVGEACNRLKVKIASCQLGCFP